MAAAQRMLCGRYKRSVPIQEHGGIRVKHKEVVSNLHVCSNSFVKKWDSYKFHFSKRILTSTHTKEFYIFFALYMSRSPTINFQLSIMSKWLSKHINTKVDFKITIRKRHDNIDISWPWTWNHYFYLGIWIDDRTEVIDWP